MEVAKMASLRRRYPQQCKLMLPILVACCVLALSFKHLTVDNPTYNQKSMLQRIPIKESSESTRGHSPTCTPATNIFFLKVHKTGSTTLFGILNRRAIRHNLRVVPYPKKPITSRRETHPIINNIMPKFTQGRSEKFNMILDHSYFDKDDIEAVLKPPIHYIAMLRNPLNQIRSWHYYNGKGREEKNNRTLYYDPLTDERYINGLRGRFNGVTQEFGASRNMLANQTNFRIYMDYLDKIFLIGITEYYAESLIYFKRRLCWDLEDLIHVQLRKGKYHDQVVFDKNEDEKLHRKICTLNSRDCELYEHFNRTFWSQVQQEGKDFHQEVEHLQNIMQNVSSFCSTTFACNAKKVLRKQNLVLWIAESEWSSGFGITVDDCALMSMCPQALANYNYYTQNVDACFKLNKSKSKKCAVQRPTFCDGLCKHAPNKTRMLLDLFEEREACLE